MDKRMPHDIIKFIEKLSAYELGVVLEIKKRAFYDGYKKAGQEILDGMQENRLASVLPTADLYPKA